MKTERQIREMLKTIEESKVKCYGGEIDTELGEILAIKNTLKWVLEDDKEEEKEDE